MDGSPNHLTVAVSLLDDYLTRLPGVPFLAIGEYGIGRGHAVAATIRSHGIEPLWLYEPVEAPTDDLEGRPLFPVYDLRKPTRPPSVPSVVLVDRNVEIPEDLADGEDVAFGPPEWWDLEAFLSARGLPESLADGNPTYASLLAAILAYEVAGVTLRRDPLAGTSWESFRNGGAAPVDDALLAYYAAYNLPPSAWWVGRNLWLKRRVPARFADLLYAQIREVWPAGKPVFPSILRVPKAEKSRKPKNGAASTVAPPPKEKGYSIAW